MLRLRLLLLLTLLLPASKAVSQTTAIKKIEISARQANRILDSLNALKDARVSAYNFRVAADSSQAETARARRAAQNYLEAKEAAQRGEQLQHTLAVSNGVKYAEANRKAHHRTVIIVVLAVWNLLTGYYIVTH